MSHTGSVNPCKEDTVDEQAPKTFEVVAPWPDYTETGSSPHFTNGVSEPVDELEAERIALALSGEYRPILPLGGVHPVLPDPDEPATTVEPSVVLENPPNKGSRKPKKGKE